MHADIVKGFADALFISAWADAFDREECPHTPPWKPGSEITEFAPQTPSCVLVYANRVLWVLQEKNNHRDLDIVYDANCGLHGHRRKPNKYDFGWYLGMQWLGTGVRWSDDHPDHGLAVGHGEFIVWLDDDNPKRAAINAAGLNVELDLA